jgi:hypothetical protein
MGVSNNDKILPPSCQLYFSSVAYFFQMSPWFTVVRIDFILLCPLIGGGGLRISLWRYLWKVCYWGHWHCKIISGGICARFLGLP